MTWECRRVSSGRVHVIPVDDLIAHEVVQCVCVPAVECVRKTEGPDGWLYTHHSLDGREQHEVPPQGR